MMPRKQTPQSLPRALLLSTLVLSLPLLIAGCNNQPDSSSATSHITRAETYTEQGQYRSAVLEVRNALQAEPNNVDHIVRLAEIYLTIGANKRAVEILEPWLEQHPDDVALPLARAYLERGKHLSAMETLAADTSDSPETRLQAALIRAEALRLSGETAEALVAFQNLSESNRSNIDAHVGLAKSYLDLGQYDQAVEVLDDWMERNNAQPEVLYLKGIAQYRENRLAEASETLTDATGGLPSSDVFLPLRRDILVALSRVLTEQGRITEAQVYNRVLAENSDTETGEQAKTAIAAIREGKIDEAKAVLRDLLKLNPENEQVALLLGTLSAGTGELEEGARLLTENLDPETSPTQFIRAATMARIDTGEREEALETLERAVEARPNDNDILAMHGILALSLPGHHEAGITSLSKAIANEPERVRLRFALAQHYIRNGQPEQALGQLRMAFTADPTDWNTTGAYLNLLLQQGEDTEATEIRDSLLNGYPKEPRARLFASIADAQLGNTEVAQERLESLINDEPELQSPKVALARLYNQTDQKDKAVAMLIEAAKITPDVVQPLQQAGQIYAQNHSVSEVERWLGEVGKTNPDLKRNADVLAALISIRRGDLAKARAMLDNWKDSEATPVNRAMAQLLRAEAQAAARSGDYTTARSKAAEAIAMEPENIAFALVPVAIAQVEGELDSALAALDGVQDTFGDEPAVVLTRTALIRQKDGIDPAYDYLKNQWQASGNTAFMPTLLDLTRAAEPDALGELTKTWLEAAPNNPSAHMARADWLMSNNQDIVASNHYEQVISLQPNNVAALNNLAWLLRDGDRSRALELAERGRELAPENPAVLDTYGWILHLSGKNPEAMEAIERALTLAPNNAEIEAHLKTIKQAM